MSGNMINIKVSFARVQLNFGTDIFSQIANISRNLESPSLRHCNRLKNDIFELEVSKKDHSYEPFTTH